MKHHAEEKQTMLKRDVCSRSPERWDSALAGPGTGAAAHCLAHETWELGAGSWELGVRSKRASRSRHETVSL